MTFDSEWWQKFQSLWNSREDVIVFTGIGEINIIVLDSSQSSRSVSFTDGGSIGQIKPTGSPSLPTFTANNKVWSEFIRGAINPFEAISDKHVLYEGPMITLLKYGRHFRLIAEVGNQVA